MALTLSYRAVGLKQVDLSSSRLGDYWSGDCLIIVKVVVTYCAILNTER